MRFPRRYLCFAGVWADHRDAKTSPRRAPVAADISRIIGRHQGPVADLISNICSDGMSAIPSCFFGIGGSLLETGLVATSPHLIARAKALDTTPAVFRTVFADSGRGVLSRTVWPPCLSKRLHSRLRCSGVMSTEGSRSP
jgi:hypothetical protein